MSDVMKGILLIVAILYALSPVDACPGPIDDLIIIVLSLVINGRSIGQHFDS